MAAPSTPGSCEAPNDDRPGANIGFDLPPYGVRGSPTAEADFLDLLPEPSLRPLEHHTVLEGHALQNRPDEIRGSMPTVQANERSTKGWIPIRYTLSLKVWEEKQGLGITGSI
jgi:hypothetical protein